MRKESEKIKKKVSKLKRVRGLHLKHLRETAALTQKGLAIRLGVSTQFVYYVEKGETAAPPRYLVEISNDKRALEKLIETYVGYERDILKVRCGVRL